MALDFDYPQGATPLDPDEVAGLIPQHITTQNDLNEWEATNILKARQWLYAQVRRGVLSEDFVIDLHRRMFGATWQWAGKFRRTDKNIGCDWLQINIKLHDLLADTKYWLKHDIYAIDEIAARFHHRLVAIHCFPNGNGRHARMMADAFLREQGIQPFAWGYRDLTKKTDIRELYLMALREADRGNISKLLEFVRQ